MPIPELPDEQIVLRGPAATIAYAVDAKGNMPAREFFENTKGKSAPTAQEIAGLMQAFTVMVEQGTIRNDQQFKKERGEIYGFKKYQARIAAFRMGKTLFLTHGFKKKQDKWPKRELDRANRIRLEHMNRTKERL
jgi:hypothetical protein